MGKGKVKNRSRKNKTSMPKWYYDACVLRSENRNIIDEIRGKSKTKEILISYLTLGEAYGSCCNDGKKFEEYFKELFEKIRRFIIIVNNDISKKLFDEIRDENKRIRIADAVHLATAIKNKCEGLRTEDRDLYGLSKNKIQKLGKKYGISNFAIIEKR